jgi:outer membrane immunogenic protein
MITNAFSMIPFFHQWISAMSPTIKTLACAALISTAMAPAAFADATAFEGFYGGFSMGVTAPDINAIPASIDAALSGDVFVGYNFAAGPNWVIGGELSYGMSGGHQVTGIPASFNLENILTISGRAGYVFGDTMVYGRAGYQTATLDTNFSPVSFDADGYVLGLGLEQMFSENISGRVEISQSYLDVSGPGVPAGTELDATRISVGVALHF